MERVHTPSKAECWDAFWKILGPALVDLHRTGKLEPEAVPTAA